MSSRKHSERRAFTLLEMIVGIAILTLLAGVLVPLAKNAIDDAKVAKIFSLYQKLKNATNKYWYDTGQLPIESETLGKHYLFTSPVGISNWKGPYIDQPLLDGENLWGGEFSLIAGTLTGRPLERDGFDIGGNTFTGQGCTLIIKKVPIAIATKINNLFDSDKAGREQIMGSCEWESPLSGGPTTGMGNQNDVYLFLLSTQ